MFQTLFKRQNCHCHQLFHHCDDQMLINAISQCPYKKKTQVQLSFQRQKTDETKNLRSKFLLISRGQSEMHKYWLFGFFFYLLRTWHFGVG